MELPQRKYKTILIDPPWDYGKGWGYGAGEYYKLMSLSGLKNLPINNLAEDNAHLYLWCPNSLLREALQLMDNWGFEFKTVITWVKNRSIFGYYFKGQTEQLLFGVKGTLPPLNQNQVTKLDGKVRKHSQKPMEQYKLIENVSPNPRIELFARHKRQGWDVWGNQAPTECQNILTEVSGNSSHN